jgi:hypothetical protein
MVAGLHSTKGCYGDDIERESRAERALRNYFCQTRGEKISTQKCVVVCTRDLFLTAARREITLTSIQHPPLCTYFYCRSLSVSRRRRFIIRGLLSLSLLTRCTIVPLASLRGEREKEPCACLNAIAAANSPAAVLLCFLNCTRALDLWPAESGSVSPGKHLFEVKSRFNEAPSLSLHQLGANKWLK